MQLHLVGLQVALGLLLDHRQQVDHLAGGRHVPLRLAGDRIADLAEVDGRHRRQHEHQVVRTTRGRLLAVFIRR